MESEQIRSDWAASRIDQLLSRGSARAGVLLDSLQTCYVEDEIVRVGPGQTNCEVSFLKEGTISRIGLISPDGFRSLHPAALAQLAGRMGVPAKYAREMAQGVGWQRDLIGDVLQTHLQRQTDRQRILIRSIEGEIRGVLSDSYQRLDSNAVASALAKGFQDVGAVPSDAFVTDLRWGVSAILPRPVEIELPDGGIDHVVAGAQFNTSDFGHGSFNLGGCIFRLRCLNGLWGKLMIAIVHRGERLAETIRESHRTYRLATEARCSEIRDAVHQLLAPEWVRERVQAIQAAAHERVQDPDKAVQTMVKAKVLTKAEAEMVQGTLSRHELDQIPSGPTTRWTLANAVSWVAGVVGVVDTDRQHELMQTAGKLVLAEVR